MTISSRTPEGSPGKCPLCQADVVIEPSILTGDAPCPQCGHLLWCVQLNDQAHCFDQQTAAVKRPRVLEVIAQQLGVEPDRFENAPHLLRELHADSLDMVELVMELEDELVVELHEDLTDESDDD